MLIDVVLSVIAPFFSTPAFVFFSSFIRFEIKTNIGIAFASTYFSDALTEYPVIKSLMTVSQDLNPMSEYITIESLVTESLMTKISQLNPMS
jgi:hypothetical protein